MSHGKRGASLPKNLRRLLVRVDEGAPGNGIAFVAGWKGHNARTVERAFREGLLVEAGPDLWQITDAGRKAISGAPAHPERLCTADDNNTRHQAARPGVKGAESGMDTTQAARVVGILGEIQAERASHLPHVEAMTARGWTWNEEVQQFVALGALDRQECPILSLRVGERAPGVWMAHFGTRGVGYEGLIRRETPMDAADDAEAWLRDVLAPLRFPWLATVQRADAEHGLGPDDGRRHTLLLALTPSLLGRVEALGYAPGETPEGVLPWLVGKAEGQHSPSRPVSALPSLLLARLQALGCTSAELGGALLWLVERIEDREADHRAVMAESCAPDEAHCSCVPHLRAERDELQRALWAAQGDPRGAPSVEWAPLRDGAWARGYASGEVALVRRDGRWYRGAFGPVARASGLAPHQHAAMVAADLASEA